MASNALSELAEAMQANPDLLAAWQPKRRSKPLTEAEIKAKAAAFSASVNTEALAAGLAAEIEKIKF